MASSALFSRLVSGVTLRAAECRLMHRSAVKAATAATSDTTAADKPAQIEDVSSTGVEGKVLRVRWSDGLIAEFPYVWLRDFAPTRRPATLSDLNLAVHPETMAVAPDKDSVEIQWPPYFKTSYTSDWLRGHLFPEEDPEKLQAQKAAPLAELWDRHNFEEASKPWSEVQSCAETRAALQASFARYGLCSVTATGASMTSEVLATLGGLGVGGQTEVAVRHESIVNMQGVHTGCPADAKVPALLAMCWRSSTKGRGTFQVTDGFAVAADMRAENRAQFDFLTSNRIEYVDDDENDDVEVRFAKHHTIGLDVHGKVNRVVYNSRMRSARPLLPPGEFGLLYRSLKAFNSKCYKKAVNLNIDPGEILFLNNYRVLHGNTAFSKIPTDGPKTVQERYFS